MVDPSIYQLIIDYASLNQADTVLDVGAGLGFLTRLMAGRCKTAIAVEADKALAGILREQLCNLPNVKVIEGSVLKVNIPGFNKVVSTPPYNISSRLLLWMFNRSFSRAVLVLQKEFAHRLVASVRSEDYGWLTVLTYYYAEVEVLDDVPKSLFYPRPEVDSVITRLVRKRRQLHKQQPLPAFKQFVQALFTQRNKKVKSAVVPYVRTVRGMPKPDAIGIAENLPYSERRVRELAPEDFGVLANALFN